MFFSLGLFLQWYQGQFGQKEPLFSVLEHSSKRDDENDNKSKYELSTATVQIHVAGAVAHPGVYEVKKNTRVLDALTLAGGILDHANLDALNLAKKVKDGQRLFVPSKKSSQKKSLKKQVQMINLNTATASELCMLPGIGEKTAALILRYRHEKGGFTAVDELLHIKGIGHKTLAKFRQSVSL
tara:strand:- start:1192 stop:1740 length:549 start_codon:yes stop_codon:yes gene_type:complete